MTEGGGEGGERGGKGEERRVGERKENDRRGHKRGGNGNKLTKSEKEEGEQKGVIRGKRRIDWGENVREKNKTGMKRGKEEIKWKWEDQRWIWWKREKDSTVQYMRETGD